MIQGEDILCFAPGPWDDIWRNRHHLMTRLAEHNRVLYIEPWPYLRPTLRRLLAGRVRFEEWKKPSLVQVGPQMHVYQPALWAPRADGYPLAGVTQWAHLYQLKRSVRELGFREPILWLFQPDMGVYVGQFHEKLVIYHVVDEYAAYSGVSSYWRPLVVEMEENLARRADIVFVTSPGLLESKSRLNQAVTLVSNAVDYGAFAEVRESGASVPRDIGNVKRPIAGYVGAINDKLDLPMLARVVDLLPDWQFLLVGPVSVTGDAGRRALEALRRMSNVHLLGRKEVEDVPYYILACDVCLLPYEVNEWTRNIDSLKVYEYMACGKPVVATDIPAARCHGEVIEIARTPEAFAEAISATSERDSATRRLQRQEVARTNTWDQRVEALSAAIEEHLEKKQGRFRPAAVRSDRSGE